MSSTSFSDISMSFRFSTLAIQVSLALRGLMKNRPLDSRKKAILSEGAELINSLLNGSLLINKGQTTGSISRQDLHAFSHAVSALRDMGPLPEDVSKVLESYEECVKSIVAGTQVDKRKQLDLAAFFDNMADFFREDLVSASLASQHDPLLGRAF